MIQRRITNSQALMIDNQPTIFQKKNKNQKQKTHTVLQQTQSKKLRKFTTQLMVITNSKNRLNTISSSLRSQASLVLISLSSPSHQVLRREDPTPLIQTPHPNLKFAVKNRKTKVKKTLHSSRKATVTQIQTRKKLATTKNEQI